MKASRHRALWLVLILPLSLARGQDLERGIAYLKANQPLEAERELLRVLQRDPANAQACNLLGSIYDARGDYSKAEAFFLKAIQAAPSQPAPYNNLGISYLRQNRLEEALKSFSRALEVDTRNPTSHYNLGLLYMNSGDLRKSVEHLEQARRLKPDDPPILFNLAQAYVRTGNFGSALPILEGMDQQHVTSRLPELQNLLGTVLTRLGRLDPAIEHLGKAARLDPQGADHHYKLALAWQKKGNLEEALGEVRRAIALQQPPVAEHHLVLGMIDRERGDKEKATEAFQQALRIAPNAASTRFALAVLLRDAAYYREAIEQFERLRTARRSDELDFNLAMTYYLAGEFPKALSLLEPLSGPGHEDGPPGYHKLLAEVYSKFERWPLALDALEKAVRADPRNPVLYFELGLVLVNLNALQQAEQFYLGALKKLPDSPELYTGLAQARMLQDHYQEALDALRRAVGLNPAYAEAHYLMGNCLNETERYVDAERAYRKAIDLGPDRDHFHLSLGIVLEKQGREDQALSEFEKVVQRNPASADGHYRLGRLYAQKGDYSRALAHLRKAVDLNPKDPQSYDQLARLYLKMGQREEAQQALETLEKLKKAASPGRQSPASFAKIKPVEEYLRFLTP